MHAIYGNRKTVNMKDCVFLSEIYVLRRVSLYNSIEDIAW